MREVGHSPEVESDALASEALARGSKQDVLWRHGWNRLRKTRENRFPSTSPSLGSGLRQKQGRLSPLRRFGMTKSTAGSRILAKSCRALLRRASLGMDGRGRPSPREQQCS